MNTYTNTIDLINAVHANGVNLSGFFDAFGGEWSPEYHSHLVAWVNANCDWHTQEAVFWDHYCMTEN